MTPNLVESDIKTLLRIGQMLKEKREELGLSHAKISDITRISIGHLKSIESGDYKNFPKLVFLKGFLKNYTGILSMDSVWMLEEYERIFGEKTDKVSINPIIDPTPAKETTSGSLNALIIGVCAVILFFSIAFYLLYTYWNSVDSDPDLLAQNIVPHTTAQKAPANTSGGNETKAGNSSSVADNGGASNNEEPETQNDQIGEPAAQNTEATSEDGEATSLEAQNTSPGFAEFKYTLKLTASKTGWIRLGIDGKKQFDIYLNHGKTYSWNARQFFTIVLSQGDMAQIFLNDELVTVSPENSGKLARLTLGSD